MATKLIAALCIALAISLGGWFVDRSVMSSDLKVKSSSISEQSREIERLNKEIDNFRQSNEENRKLADDATSMANQCAEEMRRVGLANADAVSRANAAMRDAVVRAADVERRYRQAITDPECAMCAEAPICAALLD